ncbi:hypothetical protein D3P09_22065 [Paenibacillus pinisoli]|uniref:Uncharacterized protein n=1 Tax=Paenibacillus pinisoli TaxID=1276110 RepID=A0A3A6PMI1_9BACL|nr:hypothetical protein [Paenibacillus pinisoli]RJX37661.1 hypothetical protein D3P09_22065 [Paenibacillus pinisoli]
MIDQLMPLRISAGWRVEYNQFFELDNILAEDLLQLSNHKRFKILDLGWYPSNRTKGMYTINLIELSYDEEQQINNWSTPLYQFRTKDKQQIVYKLEEIMKSVTDGVPFKDDIA